MLYKNPYQLLESRLPMAQYCQDVKPTSRYVEYPHNTLVNLLTMQTEIKLEYMPLNEDIVYLF